MYMLYVHITYKLYIFLTITILIYKYISIKKKMTTKQKIKNWLIRLGLVRSDEIRQYDNGLIIYR